MNTLLINQTFKLVCSHPDRVTTTEALFIRVVNCSKYILSTSLNNVCDKASMVALANKYREYAMRCYGCGEDAQKLSNSGQDMLSVYCIICGSYNITGTAHALIDARNIGTETVSLLLDQKRFKSSDVPTIDLNDI